MRWSARRSRVKQVSEQVRLKRWGTLIGVAALEFSSHQGEALGEPAGDVEAVEHMASVGKVLGDGSLV